MKLKDKSMSKRSGKFSISIALYVIASVIGLLGVALLVDNIYIFRSTVENYVTQGYPASTVMKQLVPSQLLPGIFEPIAVYGGITSILFSIGIMNKKISKYLESLDKSNIYDDNIKEIALEENIVENNNSEIAEN